MNIASMKYLIGYRDALDSLYAELNQGYASFWTEEQYETNKWLLEKVKQKADAEGQRDERERIDSAVMPILATLARHACTADNWEQTDALIRRLVMEIKAAIRARGEKP